MPYPPDYETSTFFYPQADQVSYVSFPAMTGITLGGTQPFTVAIWVNVWGFDAPLGNNPLSCLLPDETYASLIYISSFSGRGYLNGAWANGAIQSDLILDEWCHVALTWDGNGTLTMYVNGAPYGQIQALPLNAVPDPTFQIGCNVTEPPPADRSGSLLGGVRTFGFWTSCFTAAQINAQMWSKTALFSTALVSFCDFTQSPPVIGAGPTPQVVDPSFSMKSYGLLSWGTDVATPGGGSSLNPSAAAPFSIIAWAAGGDLFLPSPSQSRARTAGPGAAAPVQGCFFANGDATDPGSIAVWLDNGVPTVTFGNGTSVAATSVVVQQYQWTCVAVTYDGTTCTIYVNGTAQASQAVAQTAAPAAKPCLMGQLKNGVPTLCLPGMLQYLSVWSIALTAAQVQFWQTEDPSGEPGCVADFACASNPPEDLVPLANNAIWGENVIELGSFMNWGSTTLAGASPAPALRPAAPVRRGAPERRLPPVVRAHLPCSGGRTGPTRKFDGEHRRRMLADFKRALSSVRSESVCASLLSEFKERVDDVFDRASSGERVFPDLCQVSKERDRFVLTFDSGQGKTTLAYVTVQEIPVDGGKEHLLTFYSSSGEVTSRTQVNISGPCALWWLSFIYSLVSGALMIMGLPTPTERLQVIAQEIIADAALMAALSTIDGVAVAGLTASNVLHFLEVLYDYGYLGQIVNALIGNLGWWGATYILAFMLWLCAPIPNPQQAIFIAGAAALVATLVWKLTSYQTECGSGDVAETAAA